MEKGSDIMVDNIVSLYQKARRGIISTLSGTEGIVLDETDFYDVGYMQSQIGRIQRELKQITDNLQQSIAVEKATDSVKKYRNELMERREYLTFYLIFLASNSFSNLDNCVQIADGFDFEFMKCIDGLQEYHRGNKEKSFQILEDYYKDHGNVAEHYLINKIFGLLLLEQGKFDKAIGFLKYALQFIPDDEESLTGLRQCYMNVNNQNKVAVVDEILALLS